MGGRRRVVGPGGHRLRCRGGRRHRGRGHHPQVGVGVVVAELRPQGPLPGQPAPVPVADVRLDQTAVLVVLLGDERALLGCRLGQPANLGRVAQVHPRLQSAE